jgi:hypothetical protein
MKPKQRGFKRKNDGGSLPAPVENAPANGTIPTVSPGFYDSCLTVRERLDMLKSFETAETETLDEEIRLLRTLIRRVLELSGKTDDLDEMIRVFNTVGTNAVRISRLLREHKKLAGGASQTEKALQIALRDIRAELDREPV